MNRKRVLYGGPIMQHWSHAWLRWMGTVRGLCVFTALMSILVIFQTWLNIESMAAGAWSVDLPPQFILLLTVVGIAHHLHKRERESEGEDPDASMRLLFEVAWTLLIVVMVIGF